MQEGRGPEFTGVMPHYPILVEVSDEWGNIDTLSLYPAVECSLLKRSNKWGGVPPSKPVRMP